MFGRKNDEEAIAKEEIADEATECESEENMEIQSYIDKKFDEMTKELEEKSSLQMKRVNDTVGKLTNGLNQLLSGMKSELEAVKNIALEKEVKIQRYEEGYDQKNIKNFLGDLLRITDYANSNKEIADSMNEIYEDLELLLEDVGVEKINFNIGDSYDGNAKVVKIIDTLQTEDITQDNTVAKIIKNGYFIQIADEQIKVIRPVEVVLYRYEN